jgi:hypothetical protein
MTKTKLVKLAERMEKLEHKVTRLKRMMNNEIYRHKFIKAWCENIPNVSIHEI